ncbi:hypothetical protein RBB78_00045 [Tunturiibacter empetritectus]|uniref:hypothetical protein n=1 Tax=Tunturiibacter empetritectus TaxID=3069691 RepID=UPI003D9BF1A0
MRTLKELTRSYLNISKDVTRVMNRLKALYRSWGIACAGTKVYARRHRSEWLGRISEASVRRRAEHCYEQLGALRLLHQLSLDIPFYRTGRLQSTDAQTGSPWSSVGTLDEQE